MLKAKLVVVGGDAKQTEVDLKLPTLIGRGREANLTVPHALVSRRHAEIFEREGRLFVRDLESLNGTFVNSMRIESEFPLDPNQLLTLGNITFRAVYEIGVYSDTTQDISDDTEAIEFESAGGQAASLSGETVPVDTLQSSQNQKPVAAPVDQSALDDLAAADDRPSPDDRETAYGKNQPPSERSTSNFSESPAPDPTVSASQLITGIDVDEVAPATSDSVKLDLDVPGKPSATDSDVGSFLRKLPR